MGNSSAAALHSHLRQDKDTIGVTNGSTARPETAREAVAETGLSGSTAAQNSAGLESTRYAAATLVIGGVAGCTAKTVVAPLDRVKILFQTHHARFAKYAGTHFGLVRAGAAIYREYGVRGLFQGHSMQLARIFPYAAIKFMTYEQLKRALGRRVGDKHMRNFLAGSLCGVISVTVSYPLDMLRVRMAYTTPVAGAPRQRVGSVAREIYREKAHRFGVGNFFRGFPLSLMGIVPYGGVSFLTHEHLTALARGRFAAVAVRANSEAVGRGRRRRRKARDLKAWVELAAGGASGAVAQTASYPFELVRRRMQIAGAHSPSQRVGAGQIAREVWREAGVRGFFVGLTIGYVKVVPMFAVSFYTYEKLKEVFDLE
ncbi:coenzyme A transporter [Coemansia guatemalensis]|uniref:Coenzyme A transporter n=1 Tax=Coemansia guatemalensis TaxID=2761395 RepID=A0A9W8I145_9FUNG|nr:coenzyme A transporter [Coemansia guatemalensis]